MRRNQTESEYLHEVLQSYSKNQDQKLVSFYRNNASELKELLQKEYRSQLAGTIKYSGSVDRSTDIITNFDVDLILPFKHDAFSSPEIMLRKVNRFVKGSAAQELGNFSKFRPQRVSGGVLFSNFWKGREIWMDVVPGMEPKKDQYKQSKDLILWDRKDKVKVNTNIEKQRNYVRNSHPNANKIIRLLKILKYTQNDFPNIKSFVLGLYVAKAFNSAKLRKAIPRGLWPQLTMVLHYMAETIDKKQFRLPDPGNRSNLTDELISDNQKTQIRRYCNRVVKRVEEDTGWLVHYFPRN